MDKNGYNDFERGDNDEYYLFVREMTFQPGRIASAYLRMGKHHGAGNDWKCSSIRIHMNGVITADQEVNEWFRSEGDRYDLALTVPVPSGLTLEQLGAMIIVLCRNILW